MSKFAKVAIKMMVDGKPQIFQPGDELPELSKHDAKELAKSKSIGDPADEAAEQKDEAAQQRANQREFDATKKEVQAATASTAPAKTAAGKR